MAPWKIHHYDAVASTQELALAEARRIVESTSNHTRPGTLVSVHVANRQTRGQGQYGRIWLSPMGGIYFSAVLDSPPPACEPLLPLAAGLAMARTLRRMGLEHIAVRWPNDVLAGKKKIAGVLCQSVTLAQRHAAVVGVGLNVNSQPASLGPQLQDFAASLLSVTGRRHDLKLLRERILNELAEWIRRVAEEGFDALAGELIAWDALGGSRVIVDTGGRSVAGRANGFGPDGALRIETPLGPVYAPSGTIRSVNGEKIRPER